MRRASISVIAVVAVVVLGALAWAAEHTKVRLERIDASEFAADGKIKVFASVVELEGTIVDDKPQGMFILNMNGRPQGPPEKMARFQTSNEPLDLVLVVETSALYGPQKAPPPPLPLPPRPGKPGAKPPKGGKVVAPPKAPKPPAPSKEDKSAKGGKKKRALAPVVEGKPKKSAFADDPIDKVKDASKSLLEAMNPKWRVLVIEYGGDVIQHPPFRSAGAAVSTVEELATDEESGDLRLGDAVRAALIELNKPRAEGEVVPRRLMVVVSDGLNSQMDRKTFKGIGDQAQKVGIPIHSIAFSPNDERGPLINLGEISKRSNGTFRWAKNGDDLRAQIETLVDELNKQYVLTYTLKTDSLIGKHFSLGVEDLTSNEIIFGVKTVGPATDTGELKRNLPWWVWVLMALVVMGSVVGVLLFLKHRRENPPAPKQKKAPATAARAAVAQQPQPSMGVMPAGRSSRLEVRTIGGALAGARYEVTAVQPFVVGKAGGTMHVVDDPTVSSSHAQIYFSQGNFVLQDLGSTNGTFVNDRRVTGPVALKDGDLVRFGNTQVKIRVE